MMCPSGHEGHAMKTSKFTEEICRKLGISEATFYNWKKKFGGLGPSELRRLRQLEEENAKLKRLVADQSRDKAMDLLAKNVWSAPALQGERCR